MSEKDAARRTLFARLLLFLGIFLSVVILLLGYSAGWVGLPFYILTNYQNKNCDSALSFNKVYLVLYPRFMQDKTLAAPLEECKEYLLALDAEEAGDWPRAFEAFQSYSAGHPNSVFSGDAHERGAVALMHIAQEQVDQKDYQDALANMNRIVSEYSDTNIFTDALTLLPTAYTSWGASSREAGDFEKAETILKDYITWAQNNQQGDAHAEGLSELAKTYLIWGQSLQSLKQYEEALAKFNLAGSTDPGVQVNSYLRDVYIEWGNDQLEQKDFPGAIETFKQAVSNDNTGNGIAADALAGGYVQWANQLSSAEDFMGALDQVELAKQAAVTDQARGAVEKALGEIYSAFSNSSGDQARRAMREALIAVCEKKDAPKLPIFGLNPDVVRFGVYGVDEQIPESLAARTPGEMHYIACIDPESHILEQKYQGNMVLGSRGHYKTITLQRVQILWTVSLRESATLKEYASTIIAGGMPPPYPTVNQDPGNGILEGAPPSIDELADWLQSVVK